MANSLVYLLVQEPSTWREDLLNLIYKTSRLTYLNSKRFKEYGTKLISDPAISVVTEHPDIETKCEDLSKPIMVLYGIV